MRYATIIKLFQVKHAAKIVRAFIQGIFVIILIFPLIVMFLVEIWHYLLEMKSVMTGILTTEKDVKLIAVALFLDGIAVIVNLFIENKNGF